MSSENLKKSTEVIISFESKIKGIVDGTKNLLDNLGDLPGQISETEVYVKAKTEAEAD